MEETLGVQSTQKERETIEEGMVVSLYLSHANHELRLWENPAVDSRVLITIYATPRCSTVL
jgi:hypothetical protein